MEFLRSFLRRHFVGKPVVVSLNVGCFLRRARWRVISDKLKADSWRLRLTPFYYTFMVVIFVASTLTLLLHSLRLSKG